MKDEPSVEVLEATMHVMQLLEEAGGGPVPLAGDPEHLAFVEYLAQRHGYTKDRYPAFFSRLYAKDGRAYQAEPSGDEPVTFTDGQIIDYLGQTPAGVAKARATITRVKPVSTMTVAISLVNVNNGVIKVIAASGMKSSFAQQTMTIETRDATALPLPTSGTNQAAITYSIEYTDQTTEQSSYGTPWASQAYADPTVTAPVINPQRKTGNLQNIMIGLARGWNDSRNNTDIDYWFWQDAVTNLNLLVPLQGSMKFTKPIAERDSANPTVEFCLIKKAGGMKQLDPQGGSDQYQQYFIWDDGSDTLTFSLMAGDKTAGNAIAFGVSPWASETQTFLQATVTVTLNDGTPAWSSILSSVTKDIDPVDGVAYIPPIIYVWHCLAAGTQITMADGTTKAVESLDAGMTVLSDVGTQSVQATLAQPHWGPVLVIATDGGLTLTCSTTHPVATVANGVVPASALSTNDQIVTESGTDTISSITQQGQDGDGLYNLWLAGPPTDLGWMFYANGILVGDYQMQVALLPDNNPEQLRATLPEHLRKDYESHLEEQSVKA